MKFLSNKKLITLIKLFFYIMLYCLILNIFNIGCPIKFITGIPCAGCGMTRAFYSLFKLNIHDAFIYHPLFWMVPIFIIIYLFKNKIPNKTFKIIVGIYIVAFITCYLIRLFNPNDTIIYINLKESIFYKLYSKIYF